MSVLRFPDIRGQYVVGGGWSGSEEGTMKGLSVTIIEYKRSGGLSRKVKNYAVTLCQCVPFPSPNYKQNYK